MNKLFLMSFLLFFILAAAQLTFGEPYKNKNFPPDEVIINTFLKIGNIQVDKILGKYKDADGVYHLWYRFKDGGISSRPLLIYKLDTDYWIFRYYSRDPVLIDK